MNIARRLQDEPRYAFHRFVIRGLFKSVLASGDGTSPDKAYIVITMNEEYEILNLLGLEMVNTKVLETAGHSYDAVEILNPTTHERSVLYFNVDRPLTWLRRQLKAPARK